MLSSRPVIDLAILSRTADDLHPMVAAAITAQENVDLRIHRIVGTPHATDRHSVDTIVRARNEAVRQAQGDWLMFLDDDVVLAADCVARLHHALACRPNFGAFAADYLGDCGHTRPSQHVAMGATMFRTQQLPGNPFRSESQKCECLCRCLDMRSSGIRIEYLSGARATHRPELTSVADSPSQPAEAVGASPSLSAANESDLSADAKVLAAFDRRDVRYFREVFLNSLRASGNFQEVIVVAYGLRPRECRVLANLPGVQVIPKPYSLRSAPVRRLQDFGDIAAGLPKHTPVAYWDAADVVFQDRLDPLWNLTQSNPDRLLAVSEPLGFPGNPAVHYWSLSITDPDKRDHAYQLVSSHPFLNSGFGAGTASAMLRYFRTAERIRNSSDLAGTTDWSDQMAMNLYCHQDSSRWLEVADTWNYCMQDRPRGTVSISGDGVISRCNGRLICVVHGNGKSLRQLAIRPTLRG